MKYVEQFCEQFNIPPDHGVEHAKQVVEHARQALIADNPNIIMSFDHCKNVLIAAAIHDMDDRKFFPDNREYQNAKAILCRLYISGQSRDDILKMVSLVSCSSNGNHVDTALPNYFYFPRYADRIAACGKVGLQRCRDYTLRQGLPLATPETYRATCREDLYTESMMARFEAYTRGGKQSASLIDHMYDKLLHLLVVTGNSYIDQQLQDGQHILEEFVLEYGRTGVVPDIL